MVVYPGGRDAWKQRWNHILNKEDWPRGKEIFNRVKDREREVENARECARDIIAKVICQSEVEHNCGVSTACPACLCCKLVDRRRMEEEIDHPDSKGK